MDSSSVFIHAESAEWEKIDSKTERQVLGYDKSIMMVKVRFKKGGVGVPHKHSHTQVTYVAEGIFRVWIEQDTSILKKGDSFFIPSNRMHYVECLEDGVLLDAFSPFREDFIEKK